MTVTSQPHELTQGDLVYDSLIAPDVPWLFETTAEDASFGNPVPLVEEIRSLLIDGSLAESVGHDNREVSFRLCVKATDGLAMAQAEAALMAEVLAERPSPLVYTPPAVDAWPAVFDVVHMRLERDYGGDWDFDEKYRQQRYYRITLVCLPWVHDPDPVTIPALPVPTDPEAPATYTVIDTCDSTSGWTTVPEPLSAWSSISISQQTGYVRGQATVAGGSAAPVAMGMLRTGAVSMSTDPYLTVDVDVSWIDNVGVVPDRLTVSFSGAAAVAPVAMLTPAGATTWRRFYFEAPASPTSIKVRQHFTRRSTSTVAVMRIYEIGRADRIEIAGSNGFQIARTATVEGSAPTQAALSFDAGVDPLIGSTALIYTGTSPVVPLRNLRTASATVTVDATKISGATNNLSSSMVFRVPATQLTDSTYALVARLSFTGTFTVNWQARMVAADGTTIPGSDLVVSGAALVKNATADSWKIHDLAAVQLPVVALEGANTHAVEITLSMTSGGTSVLIDEGWLCDTDNGAVTVVHEPSAFQLTMIELRSPQLDAPRPAVIGTWVTHGTQDISRLVTSWGTHLFKPGLLHVFTATDLAKYAQCELTYYRRYHSHPGPALVTEVAA